MRKGRVLLIVLHVLFWVVSAWAIMQVFSIRTQQLEIINGEEFEVIERDPVIAGSLLFGQVLRAAACYLALYLLLKWSLVERERRRLFFVLPVILVVGVLVERALIDALFGASVPVELSAGLHFFFLTIAIAYGLVLIWQRTEARNKELVLAKRTAELETLRARLHPHFLFNTLNNLMSLAQQNRNEELTEGLDRLARTLRHSLHAADQGRIGLDEELNMLQDVIDLYLVRYAKNDQLDIAFHVEGDAAAHRIEPGLLVPFIENAFKHGVRADRRSHVSVRVDASRTGTTAIRIENSLQADHRSPQEPSGLGLRNVRERLAAAYSGKHTFNAAAQGDRYVVELTLLDDGAAVGG